MSICCATSKAVRDHIHSRILLVSLLGDVPKFSLDGATTHQVLVGLLVHCHPVSDMPTQPMYCDNQHAVFPDRREVLTQYMSASQ